jgi:hypothetical protein
VRLLRIPLRQTYSTILARCCNPPSCHPRRIAKFAVIVCFPNNIPQARKLLWHTFKDRIVILYRTATSLQLLGQFDPRLRLIALPAYDLSPNPSKEAHWELDPFSGRLMETPSLAANADIFNPRPGKESVDTCLTCCESFFRCSDPHNCFPEPHSSTDPIQIIN